MSIVAIIPVASLIAANAALESQGFGPSNFSVPAYGGTGVTHAALHVWDDPAFLAALKLLPNVVVDDGTRAEGQWEDVRMAIGLIQPAKLHGQEVSGPPASTDPVARTRDLIEAQGAKWGAQAPALPTTGNVTAGSLYRFEDGLWSVIQTFSRTTYGAHPSTYPALIRQVREPGSRLPWMQPSTH